MQVFASYVISCAAGCLQESICGYIHTGGLSRKPFAGTGKTMVGVAAVRALLADPTVTVLLLTYTNHALDQFCEAILASGVPDAWLLRLGQRCQSERLQSVSLPVIRESLGNKALSYEERARRLELYSAIEAAEHGANAAMHELLATPWATAERVQLDKVEDDIEVS